MKLFLLNMKLFMFIAMHPWLTRADTCGDIRAIYRDTAHGGENACCGKNATKERVGTWLASSLEVPTYEAFLEHIGKTFLGSFKNEYCHQDQTPPLPSNTPSTVTMIERAINHTIVQNRRKNTDLEFYSEFVRDDTVRLMWQNFPFFHNTLRNVTLVPSSERNGFCPSNSTGRYTFSHQSNTIEYNDPTDASSAYTAHGLTTLENTEKRIWIGWVPDKQRAALWTDCAQRDWGFFRPGLDGGLKQLVVVVQSKHDDLFTVQKIYGNAHPSLPGISVELMSSLTKEWFNTFHSSKSYRSVYDGYMSELPCGHPSYSYTTGTSSHDIYFSADWKTASPPTGYSSWQDYMLIQHVTQMLMYGVPPSGRVMYAYKRDVNVSTDVFAEYFYSDVDQVHYLKCDYTFQVNLMEGTVTQIYQGDANIFEIDSVGEDGGTIFTKTKPQNNYSKTIDWWPINGAVNRTNSRFANKSYFGPHVAVAYTEANPLFTYEEYSYVITVKDGTTIVPSKQYSKTTLNPNLTCAQLKDIVLYDINVQYEVWATWSQWGIVSNRFMDVGPFEGWGDLEIKMGLWNPYYINDDCTVFRENANNWSPQYRTMKAETGYSCSSSVDCSCTTTDNCWLDTTPLIATPFANITTSDQYGCGCSAHDPHNPGVNWCMVKDGMECIDNVNVFASDVYLDEAYRLDC